MKVRDSKIVGERGMDKISEIVGWGMWRGLGLFMKEAHQKKWDDEKEL